MKIHMSSLLMTGILVLVLFASATAVTAEVISPRGKPSSDSGDETATTTDTVVPRAADGIVNKYALVIGVSDYEAINDLSYCDEDASDWYNYLNGLGYTIKLLGDSTSPFPRAIDGLATEYNIKQSVAAILAVADADDIFVYASSGHGTEIKSGKGRTATYIQAICTWDCSSGDNGENGLIYDSEFKTMWAAASCNVFIFLDHCFSGGMNELFTNANAACFYMTTTCTYDGYGYDVPAFYNGMWTYYYLEMGIIGQGFTDLHACFVWAHAEAVADGYDGADEPCEFGVADFTM
jgi:hypothetical protein